MVRDLSPLVSDGDFDLFSKFLETQSLSEDKLNILKKQRSYGAEMKPLKLKIKNFFFLMQIVN